MNIIYVTSTFISCVKNIEFFFTFDNKLITIILQFLKKAICTKHLILPKILEKKIHYPHNIQESIQLNFKSSKMKQSLTSHLRIYYSSIHQNEISPSN